MKQFFSLFFTCILLTGSVISQSPETLKIRSYREANEAAILNEFVSLLSIPNIAADSANLQNNTFFIMDMMKKRGIGQVKLLSPVSAGAPPSIYGEVMVPGAKQTLIFYAHYDGQPVNPSQWAKGLEPFKPVFANGVVGQGGSLIDIPANTLKYDPNWRIYGRSSSDDKAGVMSILTAYDAIVKSGFVLNHNIKFFFEGEEEAASPHLGEILDKHKDLLQSDLWIICDGPVHQSGKKQIVFGVRGDTHLDLTVYASVRPLHSGHYGNWAPNPAMMLAQLLASMKDDKGRVTIKGFYDDMIPISAAEKKALKEAPSIDQQMKDELGILLTESGNESLVESLMYPSLNINGMQSANVGKQASNVIPTTATAVLDLRLVPGNDWRKQQDKVIEHIRKQGYTVIDHEPTADERKKYSKIIRVLRGEGGYNAQRTSLESPIAQKVVKAVQSTTSEQVVILPTTGSSLPLFLFEKYLKAQTITVPVANHDNNQHAENENIRLQNFWNGIETMAALMMMK